MKLAITPSRGLIVIVGALVLALLGLWGISRAIDGIRQAKLANNSVQGLDLRFEAIENGSIPEIALLQGRVSFVKSQFGTARSQLTPFLQVAPFLGWVPGVGSELRSSQDMLALGSNLAQASQDLLTAVEIASFQTSQTNAQILEGNRVSESVIRTLTSAEPFFLNALVELEQASDTMDALKDRDLPASFQNMLTSAQRIGPSMENFARAGLAASQLYESFLGYDRPRSYLMVAQNSDELRATGGFIPGAWVLTLDRGEIMQLKFWDTVAVDNLDASPPLPPEGLLQSLWAGAWLFRDAGWYPDFPTSASVIEQMFDLGQQFSVDGTIAFDQWAFKTTLDAMGPITLYNGEVMDSDSYLNTLEKQTDLFGREFMDVALGAFLDSLRAPGTDRNLLAFLMALNKSLNEKHLMLFFHDSALQDVASSNGWSGAVEDAPGDYLMVVDSNVGFSKVNRNISQSITYTVNLDAEGESQARLDLLYTNRSSEVVQDSCAIQGLSSGLSYEQQKNTCYWDYLRVYAPADSAFISSSPFPMPQGALYRQIGFNDVEETGRIYAESGKSVFAGLFNLEVGESKSVAFSYALPSKVVQREKGRLSYNLFLQKQPGTMGTSVEVNIHLPAGYCVRQSIPGIAFLGVDEVQFNLELDSDTALALDLEPRETCSLPEEDSPLLADILPEGITRTALASVIVEPATAGLALTDIQISPQDVTLIPGQRFLFTAVPLDSEGKPVQGAELHWAVSNPAAGTISSSGLFTGGAVPGTYSSVVEVSATSAKGNASTSTTVSIVTRSEAEERVLDFAIVYPSNITVRPGQTTGLGALGWDKRSRFVQNLRVLWSMADPEAGTINQFGFFKASSIPGHYPDAIEVTVSQDTLEGPLQSRALASVTVSESTRLGELSQVVMIPHRATLIQGQQVTLIARALDTGGQPVRGIEFTWEVTQPAAGQMVRPGIFVAGNETGLYPDAIQAVATQNTPEGPVHAKVSIAVTVVPPRIAGDLSSVQLVPAEVTLTSGQRMVFTSFGMDSNGDAIQGRVEWEVVESTAGLINDSGAFKASSEPGRYKDALRVRMIQEKDGQVIVLETHATVNIVGPLDSVRVTRSITTLESGRSVWLFAVGHDSNGLEIPNLQFRWSVDDPSVGSITPSGLFTAGPEPGSFENAVKVTAVELDSS